MGWLANGHVYMCRRLKDKVAIVTGTYFSSAKFHRIQSRLTHISGANSPLGIGRASAHQFAHNGAKAVYVCDYDETYLATHKREIESLYPGVDVHVRQFDAGDADAVKAVVDDAISRYGRLDVMFANAGIIGTPKVFTDIDSDGFMKTLRTNTLG
jgi:NAD(P)-dependent dehydrogenase (short-subunit alcohol dehydrogenase family)